MRLFTPRLLFCLALLLTTLVSGCSPAALLNATVPTDGITVLRDIQYGKLRRESLDVYRPSTAGSGRPVVVFLYGGSWRDGSKAEYLFVAATLARRGVVVVVPDYRVYPEVRYPAFLRDCARAVGWTLAHAASFGGDPARVSVVGHSAGAYNALMLALDPALLGTAGRSPTDLAGVVGLAGPYDFLPITDPEIIPIFPGGDAAPATQPINHVDGRNPPLLLLAGDADETVEPRNTAALASRVRYAGGAVRERFYPGIGHLGIITEFAPPFRSRAPVLDDVLTFVERVRSGAARAASR